MCYYVGMISNDAIKSPLSLVNEKPKKSRVRITINGYDWNTVRNTDFLKFGNDTLGLSKTSRFRFTLKK